MEENIEKESGARVSFFKLFRYATCSDVLMMVLGAVASFMHGSGFPVAMAIFGSITNAFINHAKTNGLYQLILCSPDGNVSANLTVITAPPTNCSQLYALPTDPNLTCISYQNILQSLAGRDTECLTNDLFIDRINIQVYIFIGVAVLAFLFGVVQIWFFKVPSEHQIHKMRLKFYACILKKDSAWFDLHDSGTTLSHLSNGVEIVHGAIGDNIGVLIQWLSTFLAAIIVSLVIQYQLALLLLVIVPFMGIAGYTFTKLGGVFSKLEQKYFSLAGGVAQEVLGSITTVQVYGGEEREQKRFDENLEKTSKFGVYKGLAIGCSVGSVYFLIFLVYSVSFWFGAFLVSRELAQLGDVITVFFSILIGAFYMGQAGPNLQKLAEAQAAAAAIYEIIDQETGIDSMSEEGLTPVNFQPSVTFNNVKFVFPSRPEVQVLNGLNLTVPPGEKVALVGSSGSGKSTVIKLIQRLYDAVSGEVLVGGVNVKDLNLKWLRRHIGVVSQEPVLFDTSIAENIALGKEDATVDEIEAAAKKANAHEFITSLPEGYNTQVGEGGTQMSGGQKQRIAIARALVRDPKILLLDEATSALDTKSESIVQEALDRACAGRTTITIAHRLSTIRDAHVILAMEAGQVVEMGTHAQLMDSRGKYFDLVSAQELEVPTTSVKISKCHDLLLTKSCRGGSIARHYSFLFSSSDRQRDSASRRRRTIRSHTESESAEARIRNRSFSVKTATTSSTHTANSVLLQKSSPLRIEAGEGEKSIEPYERPEEQGELEEEEEDKVPTVSFFRLLSYNYKMFPVILLGCVGAIVNGLVFPSFSIIFGEVINVFGGPLDQILSRIHPYAAAFLAIGVISAISVFIKFVCFTISGFHLASIVRSFLFKAFLRQDKAWYDKVENSTGVLTTMLATDASLVQGVAGIRIGSLLEVLVSLLFSLGVAFAYSWVTAFVILGFMPMVVLASVFHYSVSNSTEARSLEALTESNQLALESVNLVQTVQAFGVEDLFYNRFKALSDPPYRKALRLSFLFGVTYAFSQVLVFFAYIITFRFGAFQVTLPTDNVASAMFQDIYRAFAAIIFVSIGIGAVGAFIPDSSKANAAVDKVFTVINRPLVIDTSSELGHKPDTWNGVVQFRAVDFSYPSRKKIKILDNLNLTLKGNRTVGLVGASGSGKSTIMTLLQRFYDPSHGSVSLDGNDFKDINLKWLRSQIGIVAQEPVLFDASIADNIRYGALFRDVSEDEIISAAKQANIHDFIETLPMGYNTNAGAKGAQMSGGQKQRIAIARALVRDPKILLLDEATSALDTESEKVVQEALDKAREGRTTIIIAHRLSTIQNADKIAILEGGSVVEQGTHSELLSRKEGVYYRMVYNKNKAQE